MTGLAQVVIVGAGPAGMTAAADLAHYGIPSLVLDEGTLREEGSRASPTIPPPWLFGKSWELPRPCLPAALPGHAAIPISTRRKSIPRVSPPLNDALPSFLNLGQYYVERCLLDRIEAQPLVDLRWNHRVTGLKQSPNP